MTQSREAKKTIAPDLIADFLLSESRERGDALSNLKLQKLLYYADAWSLALYDKPLFKEDFRAWVHGPVLLSQYHRFKENEWRPIREEVARPELPATVEKHLMEVIDVFGVETAVGLELMAHEEKPWLEARGDLPLDEPCNAIISKETMKNYYRSLL